VGSLLFVSVSENMMRFPRLALGHLLEALSIVWTSCSENWPIRACTIFRPISHSAWSYGTVTARAQYIGLSVLRVLPGPYLGAADLQPDIRAGEPGGSYPRYVGGERNGPPEDCGGIPGFYEWLEAFSDPTHEGHAEAKEWADDYDPNKVDELPVKYALSRIVNRRNAAKARIGKEKIVGRRGRFRRSGPH
jgi:hypothetical protein